MYVCYVFSNDYAVSMNFSVYACIIWKFYLYINQLWVTSALGYFVLFSFVLFARLLMLFTLGMLNKSFTWGKYYFCLLCVNPKPHQSAAHFPWSGPHLTFYKG